jgi:hypothetical protein
VTKIIHENQCYKSVTKVSGKISNEKSVMKVSDESKWQIKVSDGRE